MTDTEHDLKRSWGVRLKVVLSHRFFWGGVMLGLIVGMLVVLIARYVAYNPPHTHYHANFAVYIDGRRQEFKGMQYYEDVGVCSLDKAMTPKGRVHMHNNVNDVVHVHDQAVTWGEFFRNLGWVVDEDFIKTDTQLLQANDTQAITFVLNGQEQIGGISAKVIGNEDKLLVNFGATSADDLKKEYTTIDNDAHKANHSQDPATCAGHEKPNAKDRLRHLLN